MKNRRGIRTRHARGAARATVDFKALIREVPDFPKPGILFYDITTLLKDARAFRAILDELVSRYRGKKIDKIVGIESRGFILGGPLSDRLGGARLTMVSGLGLLICALAIVPSVQPSSIEAFPKFVWLMLGLFFFAGIGNASTFRQIPIIFAHSPRQAGGVLGWTAAVAAYGPFMFSTLVGLTITKFGSPRAFFYAAAAFYAINLWINWWYYARRNAERRS